MRSIVLRTSIANLSLSTEGASETQEPVGKFALGRNEDQIQNDTITLNYSQLIEPRPVYKCDRSG